MRFSITLVAAFCAPLLALAHPIPQDGAQVDSIGGKPWKREEHGVAGTAGGPWKSWKRSDVGSETDMDSKGWKRDDYTPEDGSPSKDWKRQDAPTGSGTKMAGKPWKRENDLARS